MCDSLGAIALTPGLSLSPLRGSRLQPSARAYPPIVPVPDLSPSDFADRRHRDAGHQAAADPMVPGDLPHQSGQNRTLGTRTQALPWGELPYGVDRSAQIDAGNGLT